MKFFKQLCIFLLLLFFLTGVSNRGIFRDTLNYYMNLTIEPLVKMTGFVILLEIFLFLVKVLWILFASKYYGFHFFFDINRNHFDW